MCDFCLHTIPSLASSFTGYSMRCAIRSESDQNVGRFVKRLFYISLATRPGSPPCSTLVCLCVCVLVYIYVCLSVCIATIFTCFFLFLLQHFDCRNHIRVIQPMGDGNRLYMCGTNAHNPKDWVIYVSTSSICTTTTTFIYTFCSLCFSLFPPRNLVSFINMIHV